MKVTEHNVTFPLDSIQVSHKEYPSHICVPAPSLDLDLQRHVVIFLVFNDLR